MGKFGKAAVSAANLIKSGKASSPLDAWKKAVLSRTLALTAWEQNKPCPKNTFLGLCAEGVIDGIASSSSTGSVEQMYAKKAVALLRADPSLAGNKSDLWLKASSPPKKHHDSQMDVVVSLWNTGLIKS